MFDGLKHAFRLRPFWFSLLISFVGMGIFNGVMTWIENIIRPQGFTPTDAGTLGAVLIFSGLAGAVIMPAFSDRERKRQKYLFIAITGAIPGIVGIAFSGSLPILFLSAAILGFFLGN